MFKLSLKVINNIKDICSTKIGLLVNDEYELSCYQPGNLFRIHCMKEFSHFVIEENGMWLMYDMNSEKPNKSFFIDIYDKNLQYPELEVMISKKSVFLSENIVSATTRFIYNAKKKNGTYALYKGKFTPGATVVNDNIYVKDKNKGIICLTYDFDEKWSVSIDKFCFTDIVKYPQSHKNLIIINVGEKDDDKRGEFELNAYSADDGSLVWQVMLETAPHSSNVIGDKVYITIAERMMIIDAATGKTLLEKPHHFESDSHHLLYPYQGMLIAISQPDAKIHVFDSDGVLKQRITLPDGYLPSHVSFPVEYDGSLYMDLSLRNMLMRGTSSVLVTLTPDETAPETITLELPARPPFRINIITTKDGEHEHEISISHGNLDEIILYATILLKEIGLETSSNVETYKRDKKHNGTLRLFVDSAPLNQDPETLLEKLHIVKDKVEWHLKSHHENAGDKNKDFNVVLEVK